MKRFKAAAQRITAFVLAAGMMASIAAPVVLAAEPAESPAYLETENTVDELGNIDLADETFEVEETPEELPEAEPQGDGTETYIDWGQLAKDAVKKLAEEALKQQEANWVRELGHTDNDHTFTNELTDQEVQPICTTDGKRVYECTYTGTYQYTGSYMGIKVTVPIGVRCRATHTETIAKLNHDYTYTDAYEFDCQPGTRTYVCSRGDDTHTEELPAKAPHTWTEWTTVRESTCAQAGEKQRTCTVCGEVETQALPQPEHIWGEYYDDGRPGCCDQYKTRKCTACGTEDEPVYVSGPVRAHKFTNYQTIILRTFAKCDYEGCDAEDVINTIGSTDEAWKSTKLVLATQASSAIAGEAETIIQKALHDTDEAVKNASTREEAIQNLDSLYTTARAELMNIKVTVAGYDVPIPVTGAMADAMLKEVKGTIDNMKALLSDSFLSLQAIQTLVSKVTATAASSEDDVKESLRQLVFPPLYRYLIGEPEEDTTQSSVGSLILTLADKAVTDDSYWDEFLDAIIDDVSDMIIEYIKKSEKYGKYLHNRLGEELLVELKVLIRQEMVNDDTFVTKVRGIAGDALSNAATGVRRGWSDEKVLSNLRADLMPVTDAVEEEMLILSGKLGDLVDQTLQEKFKKWLPFGDLTAWIGEWIGGFASEKVSQEIAGETGTVRKVIEKYIRYITCGTHDRQWVDVDQLSCTQDATQMQVCTRCGWEYKETKRVVEEKLGHDPVVDAAVEPTETEEGLTEGSHCARCGLVLEPQEVIPALQPYMNEQLVCSSIPDDAVQAMHYKNRKKLDIAIDTALVKAGYSAADSQRFLAQVNSSIGILSSDRYPEAGVTGYVPRPAQTSAEKTYTWYAVQLLTVDAHGHSAGEVIVTPVTLTDKGLQLTVYAEAVVALAWKEAR